MQLFSVSGFFNQRITAKKLVSAIIIVFVLVNIFGLVLGAHNDSQSHSITCSEAEHARGLCLLDTVSHISHWQQTFSATASLSVLSLLPVYLGFLLLFFCRLKNDTFAELTPVVLKRLSQVAVKDYYYYRRYLASGIIHPQLY